MINFLKEIELFFCGLHHFSRSGIVKDGKMSFNAVMGIATLYTNYSNKISVKPPAFVFKTWDLMGKGLGIDFK